MRKPVYTPYVNNKGADQPAHPHKSDQHVCCSLLRSYNICSCYTHISKIIAWVSSWADQFVSYLVGCRAPNTGFLVTRLNWYSCVSEAITACYVTWGKSGFTLLLTIFQSHHNTIWLWKGPLSAIMPKDIVTLLTTVTHYPDNRSTRVITLALIPEYRNDHKFSNR